jgi:hypothetical protein
MSQILMMPTINAIILADPNLTMAMVVWSLTLGLITGMGYFTFLEGAINFAKSGFKMP